jgi:uncharacterized protein DUF4274
MPLSEKRKQELMRLVHEGGDELTQAIERGEKETEKHLQKMGREISDFLKTCTDKEELDFFAENWSRDGREKPIHQLVQNPHVDAGTLLRLFWLSDPEYFYESARSASEMEVGSERDIFITLEIIERRITQSEYKTASIPFDPKRWITMRDEHAEFARRIPEIMLRPIAG